MTAKAIAKSIRIISVEELKKLGEEIFDSPDRPWRETFLSVVTENPGATFYHASAGEGVIILYSRDNDKGLWYLPGSGLGPLPEGGRQMMKRRSRAGPALDQAIAVESPSDIRSLRSCSGSRAVDLIATAEGDGLAEKVVDHIGHRREAVYAAQFAVHIFVAEPVAHGGTRFNRVELDTSAVSSSAMLASVCALCMSTSGAAERSSTTSFGGVGSARTRLRIASHTLSTLK